MTQTRLLTTMAVIETVTGVLLLAVPDRVLRLLFGDGAAQFPGLTPVVLGAGLLALGLVIWTGRDGTPTGWRFRVMLAYNGLAATALAALALLGGPSGPLLWPTVLVHAVLAAWQLRAFRTA